MIYISRIRLKNFKSFKVLNVVLPQTYICFAGPNGSGKSNLGDSIRFVMGEISLKSLRAKKVKDLIHHGAKTAEVTINFDGDTAIEIKRVIREDGKILYRLNGMRTTRSAILEALKKYNLDDSGRNIIAQGEVSRIINMGGKERRTIIDSVAGISDFEAKKKEALKELEVVEIRMKEANLVLGERQIFLKELEKEKETAEKFLANRTKLNNAKGTLLKLEIEKIESDLEKLAKQEKSSLEEMQKKEDEIKSVDSKISDVDRQRMELSSKMQENQKSRGLIKRIEEL